MSALEGIAANLRNRSRCLLCAPAQIAGLRPGDEIIGYDGKRIFSMIDLTDQTIQGEPGETILVDVIREGFLMQVAVSRGPLGITGGGRFRP